MEHAPQSSDISQEQLQQWVRLSFSVIRKELQNTMGDAQSIAFDTLDQQAQENLIISALTLISDVTRATIHAWIIATRVNSRFVAGTSIYPDLAHAMTKVPNHLSTK